MAEQANENINIEKPSVSQEALSSQERAEFEALKKEKRGSESSLPDSGGSRMESRLTDEDFLKATEKPIPAELAQPNTMGASAKQEGADSLISAHFIENAELVDSKGNAKVDLNDLLNKIQG